MLLLVLKHTNLSQHHLCNTQCITDKHLQEGISNISINLSKKFSNHFLFVCVNVFVFVFTIYDSQTTNYRKTVRVFVYITIRPLDKHIEKYSLILHLNEIRDSTQRLASVEKPDTFCTKKCAFHWSLLR